MKWRDISDKQSLFQQVGIVGNLIRSQRLDIGKPTYALPLLHGVLQAILSEYSRMSAIEFGVAEGSGLLDLCKAADYLSDISGVEIAVFGLDSFSGLPKPTGQEDHPELWHQGQFKVSNIDLLETKLPRFARLVKGEVENTTTKLRSLCFGYPIGFVSIDLDYYSSTRHALNVFTFDENYYIPAVPTYLDDVYNVLTYNPYSGEEKAVIEFNENQNFRKIVNKPNFAIPNFHVCHVLDHPIRTGQIRPKFPFEIFPF
jgi:hypothetical protein